MSSLFHIILYQPILNLFVWLYNVLPGHDLGLVILVITVAVRLILYPVTASSIKAQKSLQELQPKMDAIKKQYADDKQKQAQATMELYKNNKINPLSSCLPLVVQLVVLLALSWALRDGLASTNLGPNLYSFVHNPGTLNPLTLGKINLMQPSVILALLAGVAQFFQAWMLSRRRPPANAGAGAKDEDMAAMMNKQMLYVLPVMTFIIGLKLSSGLAIYWFLSTVFMIIQQAIVFKGHNDAGTPPTLPPENKVIEGQIVK